MMSISFYIINHQYNDYKYIDNANYKELNDNKKSLILDVYFDYIQIYPKTKEKEKLSPEDELMIEIKTNNKTPITII